MRSVLRKFIDSHVNEKSFILVIDIFEILD